MEGLGISGGDSIKRIKAISLGAINYGSDSEFKHASDDKAISLEYQCDF